MTQYKMTHPIGPETHALYGWDRSLGFFVTVFSEARPIVEYDRLQGGYRDLQGAIDVFIEHGFFEADDLEAVRAEHAYRSPDEFDDASQRRCAEVIVQLRRAAD